MKKFLAMLLAAMMLLSSVGALAAEITPTTGGSAIQFAEENTNDNSKLEIDQEHVSRYQKEDGTSGDVKTELWMQVDASGQIDVTVPLVLVFSTNIDGGKATEATNYKIYNNNTRNSIAVDKIAVENNDNGGTMSFYTKKHFTNNIATDADARDSYYVILEPVKDTSDETAVSGNQEKLNALAMNTQVFVNEVDLRKAMADIKEYEFEYDRTTANTNLSDANATALMTIGQGGSINLKPTMVTTPLTFVTDGYTATKDGDANEATKGIKLLTVTYTVGLQYQTETGAPITSDNDLQGDLPTNP